MRGSVSILLTGTPELELEDLCCQGALSSSPNWQALPVESLVVMSLSGQDTTVT